MVRNVLCLCWLSLLFDVSCAQTVPSSKCLVLDDVPSGSTLSPASFSIVDFLLDIKSLVLKNSTGTTIASLGSDFWSLNVKLVVHKVVTGMSTIGVTVASLVDPYFIWDPPSSNMYDCTQTKIAEISWSRANLFLHPHQPQYVLRNASGYHLGDLVLHRMDGFDTYHLVIGGFDVFFLKMEFQSGFGKVLEILHMTSRYASVQLDYIHHTNVWIPVLDPQVYNPRFLTLLMAFLLVPNGTGLFLFKLPSLLVVLCLCCCCGCIYRSSAGRRTLEPQPQWERERLATREHRDHKNERNEFTHQQRTTPPKDASWFARCCQRSTPATYSGNDYNKIHGGGAAVAPIGTSLQHWR